MPAIDHSFKIISQGAGRALARVAHLECDAWKPAESTLQATTERLADRVFRARCKKEHFIVYMEFVAGWKKSTTWSLLGKTGLLAERERLPVVTLVFILQPRGWISQNGTMRLSVSGHPTQQIWFHEIRLWEIEPEPWWENEPGLMAIYPLCRHGMPPLESIKHAVERIEATETDVVRKADYLASLSLFSELAYRGLDATTLIGREQMRESKTVKWWRNEGVVEGRRADILDLVEDRFGKRAVKSLKNLVEAIEDAERLRSVHRLVGRCENIDELREALSS